MRRVAAAIRECDWVAACSITFCGTQSAGKPYLSLEAAAAAAATAAGNILPLLGILKCGLAQGQHAARAALTSNQFLRFPPAQLRFLSAHFPNRFWKPKQAAKASVASCQSGQSCSNCRQSDWTRRRTPTQCGKFKGQCVCYAKTKHSLLSLPPPLLSIDDTRVSWCCLRFRSVCHCTGATGEGEQGEQSKPSLIVQFTIVFYAQLKILTQPWHASADRWNVVVAALALPLALALTATVAAARCSRGNNNKASCCRVIK